MYRSPIHIRRTFLLPRRLTTEPRFVSPFTLFTIFTCKRIFPPSSPAGDERAFPIVHSTKADVPQELHLDYLSVIVIQLSQLLYLWEVLYRIISFHDWGHIDSLFDPDTPFPSVDYYAGHVWRTLILRQNILLGSVVVTVSIYESHSYQGTFIARYLLFVIRSFTSLWDLSPSMKIPTLRDTHPTKRIPSFALQFEV